VLPAANSSSSKEPWQQLLTAMALQLLRWPQQQRWVLKLQHASGTVGLAVLDLAAMQVWLHVCM
jgi:hypothetical protein